MKSFVKLFALVVGAAAVSMGCTNQHYSKPGFAVSAPCMARIEAELEIGGPIEGTGEASTILGFVKLPFSAEYADGVNYGASVGTQSGGIGSLVFGASASDSDKALGIAAYNAVKEGEYDVILGAKYHVIIDDILVAQFTTANISGYGAKLKNVDQIEPIR